MAIALMTGSLISARYRLLTRPVDVSPGVTLDPVPTPFC
jgi:hypothetical protein